ncbi:hypothetical protein [Cellulomonas palmilytica]|uniref:hypothetical protein n=1 Tax=Cellulomonas palmilytica TaxID=2608402 RepID=UPI001F29CE73|nr:hypothetical protein [Cellulomonas palmilytica]UJP41138.1 hypothetical protein F1D97_06745 [Cellulomonas palmilytica]
MSRTATSAPAWLTARVSAPHVLVVVSLLAVGSGRVMVKSVTLGTIVAVALLPIWWRPVRDLVGIRTLVGLGGLAAVVGVWLTWFHEADHATSTNLLVGNTSTVLDAVLGAAVVAWARTVLRDPVVAAWFGVGMLLGISTGGRFLENPWRFGFSVPLIVLLLGLAWASGRGWLQVVTALGLAGVSVMNGGRSTSAMLVLAAAVTIQQTARRATTRAGSRVRALLIITSLVAALYQLGQVAILDGYLGQDAQERTEAQIALSGSLLAGARPESGATRALVVAHPSGFGSGTLPGTRDVFVAKTGMAELNYDPHNGYVEKYMFGSGFELHSTAADLWVRFGFAGVLLALWAAWLVVRGYTGAIATHTASALLTYLAVRTLWNLAFSPLSSSTTLLALTLGLLAVRRVAASSPPDLTGEVVQQVSDDERGARPERRLPAR